MARDLGYADPDRMLAEISQRRYEEWRRLYEIEAEESKRKD